MKTNLMTVILDQIKFKTENTIGHENHPDWENGDGHIP